METKKKKKHSKRETSGVSMGEAPIQPKRGQRAERAAFAAAIADVEDALSAVIGPVSVCATPVPGTRFVRVRVVAESARKLTGRELTGLLDQVLGECFSRSLRRRVVNAVLAPPPDAHRG